MFHDAPVEAVVVPHRRPRRQAEAADLQKRITTQYQLSRVVDYLVDAEAPFLRVALQFPDEMLEDATLVSHTLSTLLQQDPRFPAMQAKLDAAAAAAAADTSSASTTQCCSGGCKSSAAPTVVTARRSQPVVIPNPNAPNTTRLVILADTTFGSCCPDEITAQHYQCDCIIHFGEACMSKSTRLPVLYIHPHFEIQAVQQEPSLSEAEKISAALVCRVVKRVTDALLKRQQHADAAGIVPRLVVVGPHSAGKILQGAEALWTLGTSVSSSSIGVDWGKQECRDGGCSSSNPQVDAAHHGKGEGNDEDASTWIINGVRFPRLAPSETAVVQYFLFVGPSASQHLVHILGVHEHNRFHYTDKQADFFTMDSGDDDDDVLMLSILSETFGLSSEEDEAAARHRISAVEEVDAFVATALSGGLSSLYSSALAGAQLRLQKRMRQRGFNIEAVRASSAIGILVASLAIEGYYETTMLLHQLLRAYGKRSYIIYVGHLNEFKLANFVDTVDCFVAIACPNSRSSHFPDRDDGYMKPVVNPAEVLLALTADDATSKQYGIPAIYSTVFDFILPPLRSALAERLAQVEEDKKNNTTGGGREGGPSWNESAALIQMSSAGGGVLTVEGSAQGALARLHERSYVGLNPEVGQTPVQTEIADGKHGIARGYATERAEQSKQ